MTASDGVIRVPRAQRLDALRRRGVPVVVWLLMACLVTLLLYDRGRYANYTGIAQSSECQISPTSVGRIQAIVVAINDRVRRGQPVVLMDDAQLSAAAETGQATLRKLQAELTAAGASLAANSGRVATDLLRLQMNEDGRRLEALSLRASLSGDGVELERRELEMRRAEALVAQKIATQATYDNARLMYEQLRNRTEQNKQLLGETEKELQASTVRREAYERRLPVGAGEQTLLAPLREAIAVEEARIREVELQRAALVLRSPVDGQVSQVLCSGGQAVRPGDPVLTIVESAVRSIVIFVDEADSRRIDARTKTVITRRAPARGTAESRIVSIGESIQPLPPRLWRDPKVATYGRAVVVAPAGTLPLSAGELVDVKVMSAR
jgi:multidrug resistance efflux pump